MYSCKRITQRGSWDQNPPVKKEASVVGCLPAEEDSGGAARETCANSAQNVDSDADQALVLLQWKSEKSMDYTPDVTSGI